MADVKVNVYTPAGKNVGYFINPEVKAYPAGDYEITGDFFEPTGEKPTLKPCPIQLIWAITATTTPK
jgi:hypothetical protein